MNESKTETNLVEDPVCGMLIAPESAAGTSSHEGRLIHFCSSSCKETFDATPEEFAPAEAETLGHACCS